MVDDDERSRALARFVELGYEPPEVDAAYLARARARNASPGSGVLHLVGVFPHSGPSVMALCGRHPAGGWVLRPAWPQQLCASCERTAQRDGVTY